MKLESGTELLHYRLVDRIGEGGMGVVWRAEDSELGRDVAIKVLPEELSRDPERLQRFEREARLLASLNHPNVATVHGLARHDEVRFLVMELVRGRTLSDRIELDGPWAIEDGLPLMRQMAAGLWAAHRDGIIHRDLKPSNVQLTDDGRIKILDFGLAKMADDTPVGPVSAESPTWVRTTTRSGVIVGTMTYMSPEQIEGRPLDARSDLFQLGMIFAEMTTGRHPFHGLTPIDVQHAILRQPPQLAELHARAPEEFVRIVGKLLEKDREYRYPDAEAVGVDLKSFHREVDSGWSSGTSSTAVRRRWRGRRRTSIAAGAAAVILAATAAVWWATREAPAPTSAVPDRIVPFVQGEGDSSTPSFSPDGKSIVFASNRTGNWDLWVARVAGGNPVRTVESPEAEFRPRWSPDGDRVAFTRYRLDSRTTSDIWIVPALGGTERKVADGGADPAWSPDGKHLAFSIDRDLGSRIFRVPVDGAAEPTPVTPSEAGVWHRSPAWTPDGKFLVFSRSQGGMSGRLTRVAADGTGSMEELVDDPKGVNSSSPTVTPDGRYVVHSSDRGGTVNLWRIPIDGGTAQRITSGPGPDSSPEISHDGTRIAFVHSPSDPRVVMIDRDGGEERVLAGFEGGITWGPAISPDGSTIAFSRKTAGRPWGLERVSRDGGSPTAILEGSFDAIWPRFLPDGRRVLFFTWPGRQRVGVVGLDGSDLTWLTPEGEDAGYPAVSPDGSRLAYVRGGGEGEPTAVVVRAFDGGDERVVVRGATLPTFSPDGTLLAYAGGRSTTGRIGVVGVDGGEPRWLTASGTWPTWMPDGRSIAYADRLPSGPQQAFVVPVEGGDPRPLSPYLWPGSNFPFAIDPVTGSLVATTENIARASIWLAEYD